MFLPAQKSTNQATDWLVNKKSLPVECQSMDLAKTNIHVIH